MAVRFTRFNRISWIGWGRGETIEQGVTTLYPGFVITVKRTSFKLTTLLCLLIQEIYIKRFNFNVEFILYVIFIDISFFAKRKNHYKRMRFFFVSSYFFSFFLSF